MDRQSTRCIGKTTNLLILIYIVSITATLSLVRWITKNNPVNLSPTAVVLALFVLIVLSIIFMGVVYGFRNNEVYFQWNRNHARTGGFNVHLQTVGIHLFGIGSIALGIAKIVDNVQCYSYAQNTATLLFEIAKCVFFLLEMQFLRKLHGARCNNAILRWFLLILLATNISVWFYTLVEESEEIFTSGNMDDMNEKKKFLSMDRMERECLSGNTSMDRYIENSMNPYMYPFVMEFCLLAVGEIFAIWWVVTDCHGTNYTDEQNHGCHVQQNLGREIRFSNVDDESTALMNYRRRGTFKYLFYVGLLFAIILISLESMMYIDDVKDNMSPIFNISGLTYNVFLMISAIGGCIVIRKVPSRQTHFKSNDIMLLISVAGECVYLLFGVIACIGTITSDLRNNPGMSQPELQLSINLVTLVEVFVQTRLLTRGSRVDFSGHDNIRVYFQEILGYLAVCNFGNWIANSFIEGKLLHNGTVSPTPTVYYGSQNWMLITKITYPFYVFFRFHTFIMSWEIASSLQN